MLAVFDYRTEKVLVHCPKPENSAFLVELAEKASTANRKRLIVQAKRQCLFVLTTGVFAALLLRTFLCIFNAAHDRLSHKTAT